MNQRAAFNSNVPTRLYDAYDRQALHGTGIYDPSAPPWQHPALSPEFAEVAGMPEASLKYNFNQKSYGEQHHEPTMKFVRGTDTTPHVLSQYENYQSQLKNNIEPVMTKHLASTDPATRFHARVFPEEYKTGPLMSDKFRGSNPNYETVLPADVTTGGKGLIPSRHFVPDQIGDLKPGTLPGNSQKYVYRGQPASAAYGQSQGSNPSEFYSGSPDIAGGYANLKANTRLREIQSEHLPDYIKDYKAPSALPENQPFRQQAAKFYGTSAQSPVAPQVNPQATATSTSNYVRPSWNSNITPANVAKGVGTLGLGVVSGWAGERIANTILPQSKAPDTYMGNVANSFNDSARALLGGAIGDLLGD